MRFFFFFTELRTPHVLREPGASRASTQSRDPADGDGSRAMHWTSFISVLCGCWAVSTSYSRKFGTGQKKIKEVLKQCDVWSNSGELMPWRHGRWLHACPNALLNALDKKRKHWWQSDETLKDFRFYIPFSRSRIRQCPNGDRLLSGVAVVHEGRHLHDRVAIWTRTGSGVEQRQQVGRLPRSSPR